MKLSKKQEDVLIYFGSLFGGTAIIFGVFLLASNCQPQQKEPTPDPNYTIFEDSDSLELVKYSDRVNLIWANKIEER